MVNQAFSRVLDRIRAGSNRRLHLHYRVQSPHMSALHAEERGCQSDRWRQEPKDERAFQEASCDHQSETSELDCTTSISTR